MQLLESLNQRSQHKIGRCYSKIPQSMSSHSSELSRPPTSRTIHKILVSTKSTLRQLTSQQRKRNSTYLSNYTVDQAFHNTLEHQPRRTRSISILSLNPLKCKGVRTCMRCIKRIRHDWHKYLACRIIVRMRPIIMMNMTIINTALIPATFEEQVTQSQKKITRFLMSSLRILQ